MNEQEKAILEQLRTEGYPLALREAIAQAFHEREMAEAKLSEVAANCTSLARNASRTFADVVGRAESAERELTRTRAYVLAMRELLREALPIVTSKTGSVLGHPLHPLAERMRVHLEAVGFDRPAANLSDQELERALNLAEEAWSSALGDRDRKFPSFTLYRRLNELDLERKHRLSRLSHGIVEGEHANGCRDLMCVGCVEVSP